MKRQTNHRKMCGALIRTRASVVRLGVCAEDCTPHPDPNQALILMFFLFSLANLCLQRSRVVGVTHCLNPTARPSGPTEAPPPSERGGVPSFQSLACFHKPPSQIMSLRTLLGKKIGTPREGRLIREALYFPLRLLSFSHLRGGGKGSHYSVQKKTTIRGALFFWCPNLRGGSHIPRSPGPVPLVGVPGAGRVRSSRGRCSC